MIFLAAVLTVILSVYIHYHVDSNTYTLGIENQLLTDSGGIINQRITTESVVSKPAIVATDNSPTIATIAEESNYFDIRYCNIAINDRMYETISFFHNEHGLPLDSARAYAANFWAESRINPYSGVSRGSITRGEAAFIQQLTTKSRQDAFIRFAKQEYKPLTDLRTQLKFTWKEMTEDYPGTLDRLKTIDRGLERDETNDMSGPMEAAILVHDVYERSADSRRQVVQNRGEVAEDMFYAYKCGNFCQ